MIRRTFLAIPFLLLSLSADASAPDSMLFKFLNNARMYNIRTPQEKVYLHLDNNGYFKDETIWFKAYVVRASSHKPSDLSRVLYVELLNPEGELFERKLLRVVNGTAHGDFNLKDIPYSGFYEIRAYTRAMLNWDDACTFSRVLPIFDKPRKPGEFEQLTINTLPEQYKTKTQRKTPAKPKEKCSMQFYPEGGARPLGAPCRIAFQLSDKKGMPLDAPCKLKTLKGDLLGAFRPIHEGRGRFELPATPDSCLVEVDLGDGRLQTFPVPGAGKGQCAVMLRHDNNEYIQFSIQPGSDFIPQSVGLGIVSRGIISYFDTLHLDKNAIDIQIPHANIRPGVNQIVLYTTEGNIVGNRLFFERNTPSDSIRMEVLQSAAAYTPASPIGIELFLKDDKGNPVQATFSLAVRDQAGNICQPQSDIYTDLLLTSDLKGYIHHPEFYFEKDDRMHREALDLLLSVQGWRRYDWLEMSEKKPFQLKHPIEEGLLLDGTVIKKNEPVSDITLNLMMFTFAGASMRGECQSDEMGKFAFMPQDYIGNWIGKLTTSVNGKKKNFGIKLNRNFTPEPRPYSPYELIIEEPKETSQPIEPKTFIWTDTLPKGTFIRNLGEVKVKGRKYRGLNGSRYKYMGGEDAGKRHSNIYYDLRNETERILNDGKEVPVVWDWLRKRNSDFEYDTNAPKNLKEYSFGGRPVILFLDNELFDYTDKMDNDLIFIDELKSLFISEYTETYRSFITDFEKVENLSQRPPVCIFLYSDENAPYLRQQKGARPIRLQGYALPQSYVAPNYRLMDLPEEGDFRRTLYWNPDVQTDKTGKAGVSFFGNSRDDLHLHISAQGVTQHGKILIYDK